MIQRPRSRPAVIMRYVLTCALMVWAASAARGQTTIERGAYLAAAAGCGSCHTDAKAKGPAFAGGAPLKTPFGTFYAPNITPDEDTGIGRWSGEEIVDYLEMGMDPDGDFAGSSMAEVVDHSTSRLSAADRGAIAVYPRSVPAIRRKSTPKR